MKHFTLSALLLLAGASAQAQIFQSDLEAWTNGSPDGFVGARTNIAVDSIFQETVDVHGGSYAVRLQLATGSHKRFTTAAQDVTAGATYDITFWVRGTGSIRTNIYDGRADASGYGTYNPYVVLVDGAWQEVTQSVTAALTTSEAEFIFSVLETAGPSHIVIDDITISEGIVVPPTEVTITEIQTTSAPDGASPLVGSNVITSGVVTAVKDGTGYFLQDGTGPWTGIFVNDATNAPALGDLVEITATVQENFLLTRLTNVTAFAVVSTGNAIPAAEILNPTTASQEQWESVLVNLPDVECMTLPDSFQEWIISNWLGTAKVDDFLFATTPTLGAFYSITGPMYFSFAEWKILPRSVDDLAVGSSVNELNAPVMTTFPNPASTVVTVTMEELQGRTELSLMDLSGRIVLAGVVTTDRTQLDVSSLGNGVYLLNARNGEASRSARVIVQH